MTEEGPAPPLSLPYSVVPGAWVSSFVERDNLEEGARLEHNTQSMSIIGINWY